jgi:hypothetical protein
MFMKKSLYSLLMAGAVFGVGANSVFAADNPARDELENHVREVNRSGKSEGTDVTLKRISTETGVPLEQVKSMNKRYAVGPGGLMIACVLANETKKEPEQFLKQHANGKSWAALARANDVALDKLSSRLDRLNTAIGHDDSSANKKKNKKK